MSYTPKEDKSRVEKHLIYCVEDDDAIRELVVYAASSEGYEIQAFADAETMLDACEKLLPDIILLDIMLPGMDGITALKAFRAKYRSADTRVLLLTAKGTEINKVTGLDAGADDYVTKPFSVLELMARVRANLRKTAVGAQHGELKVNSISLSQQSRTASVDGATVPLTQKEFELLRFLMLNAGVVAERERLIKEVWGYEYFGETRTVDIHIKNLREKLGAEGSSIQSVRGVGYVLTRRES